MKRSTIPLLASAVLLAAPLSSWADRDKDESGHGRHGYSFKEEYWDGQCKVERKFKRNGEFKEERKCRAPVAYAPAVVVPVHVPPPAVVVHPPGGVVIHGTVQVR